MRRRMVIRDHMPKRDGNHGKGERRNDNGVREMAVVLDGETAEPPAGKTAIARRSSARLGGRVDSRKSNR